MTMDLTDTLDVALEQLRSGEAVPTILAGHPAQAEALMPLLNAATTLKAIGPVEMPSCEALSTDRNDFLAEIAHLQTQAVSPGPFVRLKGWIAQQIPWKPTLTFQRKEQRRMSALLIKATLILSMTFGSAGGTVALAANSLPDSPLYPAKLAMEQTRLNATTDPAQQAALHMTLAGVRVQEMNRLALADKVPGEPTVLRLQTHLNQALDAAAQLPDDEMLDFLTQARETIQNQEQMLEQVQAHAAEPAQEPLRQARRYLSQTRQDVETGLKDPNTIRRRTTESRPSEAPSQPTVVPVPGSNADCPTGDCEPLGDQNQYGPQPDQPGLGEPGSNPDCTTGECEPAGDQNQYGPQPDQPGSGQPGGNPDCTAGECEPAGDQNQYGPQPDQPGPGQSGGNPDCTGDCEPVGDQNQYGPQPDQPGPGQPDGNPDCTGDCEPVGDQHHNGPQPSHPTEGPEDEPPSDSSSPADQGGDNDGTDGDDQSDTDDGGGNGGNDGGDNKGGNGGGK